LPGAIGTIKLPQRQINGSSYNNNTSSSDLCPEWRAILDNLRNFFLSPTPEMLSFLQHLREAV
jgi:hypothetical protein